MNYIEAIRSGKPYRRRSGEWAQPLASFLGKNLVAINLEDLLANDWEVKQEPREWWAGMNKSSRDGLPIAWSNKLDKPSNDDYEWIRVREVLPEDDK